MSRLPSVANPLVVVTSGLDTALWRQIYDQLREAIVTGRLPAGVQLPATRVLAKDILVSRNSVSTAYDQLRAEGYLVHRQRLGTFVAAVVPDLVARPSLLSGSKSGIAELKHAESSQHASLSRTGMIFVRAAERLAVRPGLGSSRDPIPFRIGDPAVDAFPVALWGRLIARRWRTGRVPLGYSNPAGVRVLREAIAAYLTASRGVRCDPKQVFIASGTQQAVDLATRLVLSPGDAVWVENPGYPGARSAIEGCGATIVPVPVDNDGLAVEHGLAMNRFARAAYVTPSHQFPLGAVMSISRRLALLEWAAEADAWIFEDDYDSEFRYSSRPLPSLQGLDERGRVIYVGTFSKTLFPALRLAYLVSPPSLVDAFQAACALGGRYAPTDTQLVVADFITEGHFDHHLRRMRALYAMRQEALISDVMELLSEWLEVAPSAAGLHLVAWLREGVPNARAVSALAADAGVEVGALSNYTEHPLGREAVLLGYGAFEPANMRTAAIHLARALNKR
ncbi:MAG: PLP-dependent aminotransferase family protein [Gemmatimonadota bacterium]|nr:PLP-dependent aminotransferase family protein [Gemmatimonadota bacterium]